MPTETVVIGCFGCGGEETPQATCTIFYLKKDGNYAMHWLCRPCMKRMAQDTGLRYLTHEMMHPEAQEEFDGSSPTRERETAG